MSRRLTVIFLVKTIFLAASRIATAQVAVSNEPKALAVYAPQPGYPSGARSKRQTGRGIVLVNINSSNGVVTSAQMLKSTGYKILDDSALAALRQWRFKPGGARKVEIPVSFVMRGSSGYREYLQAVGHSLWLQNATHWFLPEYPHEAQDRGITGKGVVIVKIDPRTGVVTSASILKSTGHEILDNAAMGAFWHWRFKPRTVTTLEIPIQFTTKGVFY